MEDYTQKELEKATNLLCQSERQAIKMLHEQDKIHAPETSPKFDEFQTGLASTRILSGIFENEDIENPSFFEYKKALLLSFLDGASYSKSRESYYKNYPNPHIRDLIGLISKQADWNKGIDAGVRQSYVSAIDTVIISKPSEKLCEKTSKIFLRNSKSLDKDLRNAISKFPKKISRKHITREKEQSTFFHEITHRYVTMRVDKKIPEVDEGFAHTVSEYFESGNISDKKALVGYADRGYDIRKIALVIMMAKNKLSHVSKDKNFKFLDWIRKEEVRIINQDINTIEGFLQEFNPRRYAELRQLDQMKETQIREIYTDLKPVILEINYRDLLEGYQISSQKLLDDFNKLEKFIENPERLVLNRSTEVISEIKDNVLKEKEIKNPEALPLRRTFDNIMEDVMEEQLEILYNLEKDLRLTGKIMYEKGRENHAEKLVSLADEINELENRTKDLE